jgi:hypothetical protein
MMNARRSGGLFVFQNFQNPAPLKRQRTRAREEISAVRVVPSAAREHSFVLPASIKPSSRNHQLVQALQVARVSKSV